MTFADFFQTATGNMAYDYQSRLAGGDSDAACRSQLVNIPTGLGKTAAVVLAWLWNRVHLQNPAWPRRLVYCLPMRTLVEQTRDEAKKWIAALHNDNLVHNKPPKVIILMGGEELEEGAEDWDLYPEEDTILIGTQDMLLSRALNRGYGMSRYRWPVHFGLLNNDCLWVMDETQLMGVGVETSAQLDGFRHNGKMPTFGLCPTWWMSATLDQARLATVDHQEPAYGWPVEKLSETEQSSGRPYELITARKKLSQAMLKEPSHGPLVLNSTTKDDYAKQLAALIKERHQNGTLTLVVVNRVERARKIFKELGGDQQPDETKNIALIHSRFRPIDRERHTKLLFDEGNRIVIATQAVEAGVDVSARLLITELAPWSSLVQRMGRCNRRADTSDAEVLWLDIVPDAKGELLLPYSKEELDQARTTILPLADASPRALCEIKVEPKPVIRPVIRRRDLVDLFDTTPDICGQDLDVSRYIRDGDDNDVQFFWRDVNGDAPLGYDKPPQRIELCRVSIGEAVKFFGRKTTHAWRWDPLEKKWEKAERPRPGGVYFVTIASGGYHDALGWTGDPNDKPTPLPPSDGQNETNDGDPDTYTRSWQLIAEHTKFVIEATDGLTGALVLEDKYKATLHSAALWHDVGKAHEEFQKALSDGEHQPPDASALYAKSKNRPKPYNVARPYRSVRRELASALAWLLKGQADAVERDLVAYLIAAHHGKVRLSIRSLPEEAGDETNPEKLFARGIWEGDKLPLVALGELTTPEITLDLSFMKMGESKERGPSWLARTVALRDRTDLGPFRLAYLETLLRAADARASREKTT
jgi:CRISPR-associated endonuclease/helicase Cas3